MNRESRLETLVLDILRLPQLCIDPAWVRRAEAAITGDVEPTRWKCPGCQCEFEPPNPGICQPCKLIGTTREGSSGNQDAADA